MKHLREFDDQEIQDLMGDLETVGHEQMKGLYMQTINTGGNSIGRIFFAYNDGELVRIFEKEFQPIIGDPAYPKQMGSSWKGGGTLYNQFIDAFVAYADSSDIFRYVYIIDDLKVINSASKKPGMISFPAYNSFLVSDQLEKNFINAKEKLTSGDFKEEFEDEMDTITI